MRRARVLSLLTAVATPVVLAVPIVAPEAAPPDPVQPTITRLTVPLETGLARASAVGAHPRAHGVMRQEDTGRFAALGVTWAADPKVGEVDVEVRTRRGGRWSEWTELDTDAEHGPDEDSPDRPDGLRGGSAPLWTGQSDGVEVRVASLSGAAPRDVQVELVDPGVSSSDAAPGAPRGSVATAAAAAPTVITRAQWGADERYTTCKTAYSPSAKVGFVHHTAGQTDYSAAEAPAVVRAIYAFHTQSRGWCDLGYNFLVDRYGRIYEGRAGGIDKTVVGAHTGGFNANSFSASLMGTFDTAVPPPAMLDALERLFAWKLGLNHRDPHGTQQLTSAGGGTSKYPPGQVVTFDVISGHRDAGHTSCPGQQTYARLGEIRNKVAGYLGAGFVDPAATVAQATPTSRPSVEIGAGLLQPTAWQIAIRDSAGQPVRTFTGVGTTSVRAAWDLRNTLGQTVPDGEYRVRLTGNGGEVPWDGVITLGQVPTGVLDEASVTKGLLTSTVRLRGWALDRDTAAPVRVRFYLGDLRVGETLADDERPDIGTAFPGYGSAHGFDTTVSAPNGEYTLITRAVDTATGAEAQIDRREVVLGDPPPPPLGEFATALRVPSGAQVTGWVDDPNTEAPAAVDVTVNGAQAATLTAGADKEFSGVVPLPVGAHAVCVIARLASRAGDGTNLGCKPVRVLSGSAPTGVIDVAGNARDVQGVSVAGWTLDPDTADPTQVHLYVDGVGRSLRAAGERPDIAAAFPGYGSAHGWSATVATSVGKHSVCAYAINAGPGTTHTLLGCRVVTVSVQPFGALDAVERLPDGRVRVRGWDADPNAGRSPVPVHVYVGGVGHNLAAESSRPDVARAFPAVGDRHGFDHVLPAPSSPVDVCAFAINAGPGSHVLLGCRRV